MIRNGAMIVKPASTCHKLPPGRRLVRGNGPGMIPHEGKKVCQSDFTAPNLPPFNLCRHERRNFSRIHPDNAQYRRDLSVSYEKLGDVKLQLGQTEAALGHYDAALNVAEELVRLDPDNAEYRRDLWVSHWNFAKVYEKLNRKADAAEQFGKVIEQLNAMKEKGILAPVDEKWIAEAEKRMAALEPGQ
ncbi:MAG: tetratricopeptide repeat protein [Verrucomicrobiota bacterium]